MNKFKIGGKYNWKNQPERLIYLGPKWFSDGMWHQFALVEKPNQVWSEVRTSDLKSFEETPDESKEATRTS